jgi:IclR family acetate operon transcriptional repressor
MSAPIFDADGQVWAALTIAGPAERFGPAQMRPLAEPLKAAAAAVSLELGYRPALPTVQAAATAPAAGRNGRAAHHQEG